MDWLRRWPDVSDPFCPSSCVSSSCRCPPAPVSWLCTRDNTSLRWCLVAPGCRRKPCADEKRNGINGWTKCTFTPLTSDTRHRIRRIRSSGCRRRCDRKPDISTPDCRRNPVVVVVRDVYRRSKWSKGANIVQIRLDVRIIIMCTTKVLIRYSTTGTVNNVDEMIDTTCTSRKGGKGFRKNNMQEIKKSHGSTQYY